MRQPPRNLLGMCVAGAVLAACGAPDRPAPTRVEGSVPTGGDTTVSGGTYKVGVPYEINGKWYEPRVDYDLVETGVASWYGRKFDGRRTANGEIFDSTKLTAAHRTLPLPSMVRVTNLENGRVAKLRVNDRGPFARDRILDVSRRAARVLGFKEQGTTRVRVEVLEEPSRRMAAAAKRREGTQTRVASAEPGLVAEGDGSSEPDRADGSGGGATPSGGASVEADAAAGDGGVEDGAPPNGTSEAAGGGEVGRTLSVRAWSDGGERPDNLAEAELFVQAGAFVRQANAENIRKRLERLGEPFIAEAVIDGQRFYRVRFGPLDGEPAVDRLLDRLAGAGVPTAEVVIR